MQGRTKRSPVYLRRAAWQRRRRMRKDCQAAKQQDTAANPMRASAEPALRCMDYKKFVYVYET